MSLNIPFDGRGAVDFASLERLVQFHLAEGAAGFLVPAQAAEVFTLSLHERMDIVRAVRDASRGRAVVIAGATARQEHECLRLAEHAACCGCDGVLSEPLPGMSRDTATLLPYFARLAAAGPPLLMIQDLDWQGSGLPLEVITDLFDGIPSFGSLKVEVNPAGPKYSAVREATGGRLHLAGGWAALQMIEALDRGVSVFMNTALTRFYKSVLDAYDAGDRPGALRCFYRMLPVLAFTRQHLDVSIHFHKREFHHLGIFTTAHVRKQGFPWDEHHERQCLDLLEYVDGLYRQEGGCPPCASPRFTTP